MALTDIYPCRLWLYGSNRASWSCKHRRVHINQSFDSVHSNASVLWLSFTFFLDHYRAHHYPLLLLTRSRVNSRWFLDKLLLKEPNCWVALFDSISERFPQKTKGFALNILYRDFFSCLAERHDPSSRTGKPFKVRGSMNTISNSAESSRGWNFKYARFYWLRVLRRFESCCLPLFNQLPKLEIVITLRLDNRYALSATYLRRFSERHSNPIVWAQCRLPGSCWSKEFNRFEIRVQVERWISSAAGTMLESCYPASLVWLIFFSNAIAWVCNYCSIAHSVIEKILRQVLMKCFNWSVFSLRCDFECFVSLVLLSS